MLTGHFPVHSALYTLSSAKKFMEYIVVKRTDVNDLAAEVNALLNKGWKPSGGISIAFGRIRNTTGGSKDWMEVLFHAQALIKEA